jgi:lipopolysaccharide transport system permease protein
MALPIAFALRGFAEGKWHSARIDLDAAPHRAASSAFSMTVSSVFDLREPWRSLWRARDLIAQLTDRDTRSRYRGSAMGIFWSAIHPLLMLTVYTVFFSEIFPGKWTAAGSRGEFALVLFIGLLLHGFVSECLVRAPGLVVEQPNLVKKIVFPLDVLPVVAIGTALFHLLIGLSIWFVFHLAIAGLPPVTALWFPVVLAPLVLLTLGVSWFVAAIGVYLRDVRHVMPVVSAVLLFASPVFYPVSAVKPPYDVIVAASPLTIPIEQARAVLLWGHAPQWDLLALFTVAALVVAWLGAAWFRATRKGFADVL